MNNSVVEQLKALRKGYVLSLPNKIATIDNIITQDYDNDIKDTFKTLHRHIHSLAGSSAIYGQHKLSHAAKIIELHIGSLLESDSLTEAGIIDIKSRIEKLRNIPIEHESESESTNASIDKANATAPQNTLNILVAEDDHDSRAQLVLLLKAEGHHVTEAIDGKEAVQFFKESAPDLIFMDILMPNLDGYAAAKEIKQTNTKTFTPIIFLTSSHDDKALARCIETGGDRFLTKPYNRILLRSEIDALQRIRSLYSELESYKKQTEEEIELAQRIFDTVFAKNTQQANDIHFWSVAAGHFNGDVQLYKQEQDGTIHVLLGDFTGHGLGAALGSLVAGDLFHSLLEQQADQQTILYELNKKMMSILPRERFCATCMASYFPKTKKLKVWNSGLPAALLLSKAGSIKHEFKSEDLALGTIPRTHDNYETKSYPVDSGDILLIYSDGITEALNEQGEFYGEKRLYKAINDAPSADTVFSHIIESVKEFSGDTASHDDMSLIAVTLGNQK